MSKENFFRIIKYNTPGCTDIPAYCLLYMITVLILCLRQFERALKRHNTVKYRCALFGVMDVCTEESVADKLLSEAPAQRKHLSQ